MKVLIVVALVAIFQGCQASTPLEQLKMSVEAFLNTIRDVDLELESVIDCMEADGQRVINALIGGATPSACVIDLQHDLKEVSETYATQAYNCINDAVEEKHIYISTWLTTIQGRYNGLIGLITDLLKCITKLLFKTIADLLQDIVNIIKALDDLFVKQVICSNDAVKSASMKIAQILKDVIAC